MLCVTVRTGFTDTLLHLILVCPRPTVRLVRLLVGGGGGGVGEDFGFFLSVNFVIRWGDVVVKPRGDVR